MTATGRAAQLDDVLTSLLRGSPELEAAAVVSFDGLPMASALPASMDESRVAAMSAALLSLGERAAEGLGRGDLNQVYIEGSTGTVFLVSADGEAVLVAVAVGGAKPGLVLYELRRAAKSVAAALCREVEEPVVTSFPGVPSGLGAPAWLDPLTSPVPLVAASLTHGNGQPVPGQPVPGQPGDLLPGWPPVDR